MLQGPAHTIERARTLRGSMSLPEVVLWRLLRQRPGGLKFRRQHPAGPYVADFYCHEARLILEIDGEGHNRGDRPARDIERDTWFEQRGFQVLRIAANEVLRDPDSVASSIATLVAPPLHQPAAGLPPRSGEDQE